MKEIKRVRNMNKGCKKEDRAKPEQKCSASFRASKRKPLEGTQNARTGLREYDVDSNLPDFLYSKDGYTQCNV